VKTDVAGVRPGEQAGAKHERRQRQRRLRGRQVERRQRDQIPQRRDRARSLAMAGKPLAERLRFKRRIALAQAHQPERGPCCARALGERQVRIAGERARQVQRRGQRSAPQDRRLRAGLADGDLQPRLHRGQVRSADALEQRAVGDAAAQEHVLAVVHRQAVALEGVRRTAEPAPDLDQRHLRAGGGAVQGGDDAREAATDHQHPAAERRSAGAQAPTPSIPRAATHAFSCAGSDMRRRATSSGCASMRSSSRL
jgi:hypothetical protein